MRVPFTTRIVLVLIPFCGAVYLARADVEARYLGGAINTLDHFMQAGVIDDARRGASLLEEFESNERRAEYDTQRLYRKQRDLLSSYVSLSTDIYGYQVREGFRGTSVEVEGGIETLEGVTAEFKARVVYRNNEWRIVTLEID